MKSCVCLAFKYNDIYYTLNTPEFDECSFKHLIIFKTKNLNSNLFPSLDQFSKIDVIEYEPTVKGIAMALSSLYRLKPFSYCYVFVSNVKLYITQYFINKSNNSRVLFIEDGTMNYQDEDKPVSLTKWVRGCVNWLTRIDEKAIKRKIKSTYLLKPELAKYYFGDKVQLMLHKNSANLNSICRVVQGKKIFIGGNYYNYKMMTLLQYNEIVNRCIDKYSIDYYVPHQGFDIDERIHCETLDLSAESLTFEMILPCISETTFYSLGSSVLFTAKHLGNNTNQVLLKTHLKSMERITDIFEAKLDLVSICID